MISSNSRTIYFDRNSLAINALNITRIIPDIAALIKGVKLNRSDITAVNTTASIIIIISHTINSAIFFLSIFFLFTGSCFLYGIGFLISLSVFIKSY